MTGPIFKNLVLDSTMSGGVGALTLLGATLGYQPASIIGAGNSAMFAIREVSLLGVPTGPFEVSNCTYSAGTLVRNSVEESSSSGMFVNFTAGTTKTVELVQSAALIMTLQAQVAALIAAATPAPSPTPSPSPSPTPAPAPGAADTRPKFFLAPANAYTTGTQGYLSGATALTGSSNGGRAGTFSLTTTSGNYGWLAVLASATTNGVTFADSSGGVGGWSGAGLAGNNGGSSPNPSTSTTLFTDSNGTQYRLFRQDYINANPSAATYTLS